MQVNANATRKTRQCPHQVLARSTRTRHRVPRLSPPLSTAPDTWTLTCVRQGFYVLPRRGPRDNGCSARKGKASEASRDPGASWPRRMNPRHELDGARPVDNLWVAGSVTVPHSHAAPVVECRAVGHGLRGHGADQPLC